MLSSQLVSHYTYFCCKCCTVGADKVSAGATTTSAVSTKVVYPDTSKMAVYDPTLNPGTETMLFEIWIMKTGNELLSCVTWIIWWLSDFKLYIYLVLKLLVLSNYEIAVWIREISKRASLVSLIMNCSRFRKDDFSSF